MKTKQCSECGRILPLDQFNKLRRSPDGLQSRCRDCFSEYNRKRYAANREKIKADVKRYREENPENELSTRIKKCEKDPNHKNAYRAVEAALRAGVLTKPKFCSICGRPDSERRIEAHHYDYSKPLDVAWFCSSCHSKADELRRRQEGLPAQANLRPVVMMDGDKPICHFKSIKTASEAVRTAQSAISACLAGVTKTCAGFRWAYDMSIPSKE